MNQFESYIVNLKGSATLVVQGADTRRFKIYQKILTQEKFGFKKHFQINTLIKELHR